MPSKLTVTHVAVEPLTGVWTVMKELAFWQAATGYDVRFVLFTSPSWPHRPELKTLNAEVFEYSSPSLSVPLTFLYHDCARSRRKVQELTPQGSVVHFHNAWMSGALLPMSDVERKTLVSTFHGVPVSAVFCNRPLRHLLHRRWAAMLVNSECRLVSVDSVGPANAELVLGIARTRFSVIANGLRDSHVRGCPHLMGAPEFTIGFASALHESKGWRIIAEGVSLARRAGLPVRLLLAGGGSAEEVDAARKFCAEIGYGSEYLGVVSKVPEFFMPRLDALAMASKLQEGLPMAIIEALAASVPILACPTGGVVDALRDECEGLFIAREAQSVCAAIHRLVTDKVAHSRMSDAARQRYVDKYQVEVMGERYSRLYASSAQA